MLGLAPRKFSKVRLKSKKTGIVHIKKRGYHIPEHSIDFEKTDKAVTCKKCLGIIETETRKWAG